MRSLKYALLFLFSTSAVAQGVYWADDMSSTGEVAFETRVFDRDSNPRTEDWGLSLFSRVETRYDTQEFSHVFRGMARIDRKDQGRNFITLEDAYFSARLFSGGQALLLAGYKIFNWTATEAFHPADQINSRNFDGELENLEKKGELTIQFEVPFWQGTLSVFGLPRFEDPKLPSVTSRLGGRGSEFDGQITLDRARVVRGSDVQDTSPWVLQFGLNTIQSFSFGDISLHALRHVNRNYPLFGTHDYQYTIIPPIPPFFPGSRILAPVQPVIARPYYFQTTQIGGTMQLMFPVITKIEWAYRMMEDDVAIMDLSYYTDQGYPDESLIRPEDHAEVAIGFEYPYDHASGATSTYLMEATSFFGVDDRMRRRMSIFQRDLFLGYRYAFNDFMGREFLISGIVDLERPKERLYSVSFSQRLSDFWRIRLGLRLYEAPNPGNPLRPQGLELLRRSDSFNLTLTRFF